MASVVPEGLDIQRAYIKVGSVASDCNDESLSSSREVTSHISLDSEKKVVQFKKSGNPNCFFSSKNSHTFIISFLPGERVFTVCKYILGWALLDKSWIFSQDYIIQNIINQKESLPSL